MSDHVCNVDCELTIDVATKQVSHMMYPVTDINWTRSPYGPKNHTRRSWRATGQDESRNVRLWNHFHKTLRHRHNFRRDYRTWLNRALEAQKYIP